MNNQDLIESILKKDNNFAVIGVSNKKSKYGRIVYDKLKLQKYNTFGINPNLDFIGNDKIYNDLIEVSKDVKKIDVAIFVVPPIVTEKHLKNCIDLGIKKIWFQPGSYTKKIIDFCKENKIECIYDQCILIETK